MKKLMPHIIPFILPTAALKPRWCGVESTNASLDTHVRRRVSGGAPSMLSLTLFIWNGILLQGNREPNGPGLQLHHSGVP